MYLFCGSHDQTDDNAAPASYKPSSSKSSKHNGQTHGICGSGIKCLTPPMLIGWTSVVELEGLEGIEGSTKM